MTSLESIAAQWSAIQSSPGLRSGFGQLYPSLLYNITQQVNSATSTTSETSAAAISPSLKDSPSPSDLTGEQPLDLSSKPSPSYSISGDAKHVNRAKARMAPISIRRTYTEEELNNALQDIISGKLGTRRAAVQYNIPRSTLRNKVYKISTGAKRGTPTSLQQITSFEDLVEMNYEKNFLSADEEDSNGDKAQNKSLLPDISDDLASRFAAVSVKKSYLDRQSLTPQHHQCQSDEHKATTSLGSQPKPKTLSAEPPPQHSSPIGQTTWQNVLLHSLLFSGGLPLRQNFEEAIQLFNSLLLKKDLGLLNPQLLMQLQLTQQPTQHEYHTGQDHENLQSNAAAVLAHAKSSQNCLPKSETPETESSVELNEVFGDDPSVILKIPSYKPLAVSSTSTSSATVTSSLCTNKNIDNLPPKSPKKLTPTTLVGPIASPQELCQNHHHHTHYHSSVYSIPVSPPPVRCHASGKSQSPPKFSLRDVIASSISRNFNQQAKLEAQNSSPAHSASSVLDYSDQYKRPSISVIKNIGGTDTSRFATAPNLLGCHLSSTNNHHQHHSQNIANSSSAGGKGTRPKRGKYRNYDRDSLVEAVKAVQRGEMSVHRAGSYYGVPHSTLEYKVKERHLMRPRKREPKTQPLLDDRTGESISSGNIAGSTINTLKCSKNEGVSVVNNLETYNKSSSASGTSINQPQSTTIKCNPLFPQTSTNGMKITPALFEQSLSAQLQYPPHLFWHGGFGPLQMDFSARSQEAAVTVGAASTLRVGSESASVASSSDLMKSQIMQKFHDNAIESTPLPAGVIQPKISTSNNNVRDTTDNIYEPICGANASFLDGIIRKTLDRKSSESKQGGFSPQVVKNENTPPLQLIQNSKRVGNIKSLKRPGSPSEYQQSIDIKRERVSPTYDFYNSDSEKTNQHLSEPEAQLPLSISEVHSDESRTREELSLMSKSKLASITSNQHSKLDHFKSKTEDSL